VVEEATTRVTAGCPDPERLAACVDGRVDAATRAAIVEHLAACEDCYFIFSETVRARGGRSGGGTQRWMRAAAVWAGGLAAAASLLFAAYVGWSRVGSANGRPELVQLVAAVGARRTIEPRLTGGFAYAPLAAPVRGVDPADTSPLDVRMAALTIEKAVSERRTPRNLGALGVAYLVTGKPADAVPALESATRDAPEVAELWSDLAAAYLARNAVEHRLDDVLKAVNAADRATRLAPALKEAWFNRALAIEQIGGVREEARKAWDAYLTIDGQSGWSTEARRHLATLAGQSRAGWSDRKGAILQAIAGGDGPRVREAAEEFPAPLTDYVATEILAAWANATLSGRVEDATASLRRARLVADALTVVATDPMMRDVVADVAASAARPPRAAALARALGRFVDGKRLLDAEQLKESGPVLAHAVDELQDLGSPLAIEARLNLATCWYRSRNDERAAPLLRLLVADGAARRYVYAEARARRLLGMTRELSNDLTTAHEEFRASLKLFERFKDAESVALVHNLLAEILRFLGQPNESWQQQDLALALLTKTDRSHASSTVLSSAANACLARDLPAAALVFYDGLFDAAVQSGDVVRIAGVSVRRARTLARLNQWPLAEADLNRSRQLLTKITDAAMARSTEAEVLQAQGEVWEERRPEEAVRALTEAMPLFESYNASRLVRLHLARGRAHEQLGAYDAAEADYREGIQGFELAHQQVRDSFRSSHFDPAWSLFGQMIALQVVRRGRPDLALEYSERARARTLLEAVSPASASDPSEFSPSAAQSRVPERVTLVAFVELPDRLLSWAISRRGVNFVDTPITAGRLAGLIEAHQADMFRRVQSPAGRLAAAELYDALIRPIASSLAPGAALIFVPDGPLHAVAFAALVDSQTERYLIQDHAVGVAPSLALSVDRRPGMETRRGPLNALVVGNPRPGDSEGALPNLSDAQAEAGEVADLYGEKVLLTGEQVTKARFLEEIDRHDVLHFAGHALQNPEFPWLSSLILASGATHDAPEAVFAYELANRRLEAVRLVVLAACRTAAGPTLRGEGVLNLARPFMAAGVPAVIGTLWDVDDRASRRLLVEFHRQIARGLTPVEALRQAQLGLIASDDPLLRTPASWSGFVAIGAVSKVGER
jgi:CHAT domain-containing protein